MLHITIPTLTTYCDVCHGAKAGRVRLVVADPSDYHEVVFCEDCVEAVARARDSLRENVLRVDGLCAAENLDLDHGRSAPDLGQFQRLGPSADGLRRGLGENEEAPRGNGDRRGGPGEEPR